MMVQTQGRAKVTATSGELDFATLEASNVVGVLMVAPDARIVQANALMRDWLGATSGQPLGRVTDFLDEAVWSEWCRAGATLTPVEASVTAADGTVRWLRGDVWVQADGRAPRIVAVLVDASPLRTLRATALRSARMEALGSLTAGVAHDFNNLLTVLVGNLYLLGEELRERPRVFEKLKAARDAAKRGTDLIKQLLSFARREELAVGLIEPGRVIESLVPLLRRALGARIKLETEIVVGREPVRASAAQLESVIVNLAVNARDAIDGKGRITIVVGAVEIDAAEAARHGLGKSGAYVAISVEDTGSGIPADALGRVFEPFFSTKKERGGTGLGLSMVRWFAEQAGGTVTIDSTVGRGTTVRLLLPREVGQVQDANEGTMPLSTLPAGSERVVVLAQDEAIRATMHQTLEVLGYQVRATGAAVDAIAAVAEAPTQLFLIDGAGVAEVAALSRARALVPGLKAVLTMDVASGAPRPQLGDASWLGKPFSLADLAGVVRRALDSPN